ncbi:MAG: membrane protein insertase YidC [Flavobacteriaceae bacterium]|nr:membrane protein insertase YidC [Flavobacteriaceae bacterium]
MEEKKFDLNSLIGFILLFALAGYYLYNNMPSKEEMEKQEQEQIHVQDSIKKATLAKTKNSAKPVITNPITITDSIRQINAQAKLGTFEYATTLTAAKNIETTLKNEVLDIKISNLGGQISKLELLNYKTYDAKKLFLIKDNNAILNLTFQTKEGKTIYTKDHYFEPILSKDGNNQVLSMRLKISETQYLEYQYTLKPNEYLLDFKINTVGLSSILNTSQKVDLQWDLKTRRTEKSVTYENQYTDFRYLYDNGDSWDYTMRDKEVVEKGVNWISYKKQFFSTILLADKSFKKAKMSQTNLVEDEKIDTIFTKQLNTNITLDYNNNELSENMQLYYGPNDKKQFNLYKDQKLEYNLAIGTSIFRWINIRFIAPLFSFIHNNIVGSLGLAIILLTIFVKLLMSPLLYKSFLSSAKMKVLKPEMQVINEKYKGKENAMKRQQETMALQRKAGVSPMAGCIPAVLQMPIFFALFRFFPTNIDLRQENFLWAEDLSAYDEIARLPFHIPFYGSHIALFPILASISMFFYMKITQGQQATMQQPAQEGMPDMQKMMKMMMYFSPFMMLFFFNSFGSGLSIYYFISQLISILIMLVIKYYIIDENKINAQIQVNKQKAPKKKSKFRQRLDNAMKQAQEQQELKKKKN